MNFCVNGNVKATKMQFLLRSAFYFPLRRGDDIEIDIQKYET